MHDSVPPVRLHLAKSDYGHKDNILIHGTYENGSHKRDSGNTWRKGIIDARRWNGWCERVARSFAASLNVKSRR
jgi:hypothetical protein